MQRLVVDTDIYIDYLNAGLYGDVLFQPRTVKYLSAVVLMELLAGTSRVQDRRVVRGVEKTFRKARRVLAPTAAVFAEAGDVLQRLRRDRGYRLSSSNSVMNDVLIALSARSIGAAVVTRNERDYEAIRAVRAFPLIVV
jgi:predicted nucleic acid-binding protein